LRKTDGGRVSETLVSSTDGSLQLTGSDASWNSDSNMSSRDICYDYGVRADYDIIADRNRSQQLCAGSNVDTVSDGWRATMSAMAKTDRNAVAEHNVVPKHSVAANHNVEGMLD